ncbi:MAG: hypothetical protein J6U56_04215 [Spirochaetia bacterium]|nr:hypothetical protein [Spirochaetia bacterium]
MNKTQILIEAGKNYYGFSMSETGQLDYQGKQEFLKHPDLSDYERIVSSPYFTPCYYTYLDDKLNHKCAVYFKDADISNPDVISFLTHVGPLLDAVESGDTLLAGELYLRRRDVFNRQSQLTKYILGKAAAGILFSICYGRINNIAPDAIPLVYDAAKKQLSFDPAKESLEQALVRYLADRKENITVQIVGTQHYNWDPCTPYLGNLANNIKAEDLSSQLEAIRKATHDFYAGLECSVQAEPYNNADKNAIAVFIEDTCSKFAGNCGMKKAGYVRAIGAKLLRDAQPKRMSWGGCLVRIADNSYVVMI